MVHLHTRSCYSLLKSSFRIEEIVKTAKETGQQHVCLTDLNTMFATMQFIHLSQKYRLHPIVGLETEVYRQEKKYGLLFLAKNDQGLQELYALSGRITKGETFDSIEEIAGVTKQCIVMTAGCDDGLYESLEHNDENGILSYFKECDQAWDSFYCSIAMNDSSYRKQANRALKTLAKQAGIPTVALSRILYKDEKGQEQLKVLRAIDAQTSLNDETLDIEYGRFYRSQEEMEQLYDPEDLQATETIAQMCNIQLSFPKSKMPVFKNKYGIDNKDYLIQLCHAGLKKRLNQQSIPEYTKRLEYELSVIIKMGFTDYFLIVWDYIRYARSQKIYVGPGRGSAAGSLVAYCLGITHVDPIKNQLLFERFLNPERITMPDIDTDFPDDKRDQVIDYVHDLYGDAHVAHIIAFNTLKAKQVLRDVARTMHISLRHVNTLTKMIKAQNQNKTLDWLMQNENAFARYIRNEHLEQYVDMCRQLEGLPRHTTIHAAGIVLSDQPIEKVCPVIALDDQITATQFTHDYLEELGLIKMDFLGLRN
ncbi:MAG: DNA polymerase III subunit alpha, partial [Erysipelotrichaceae bacterium]|nr:DNA polymerase III subunit alpha [Erysipelotrichaceae bacterium]